MQVFYATQFVLPLPTGHRFPMAKYQLLRDRLPAEVEGIQLRQAEPASIGELALAHQPAYIQAICTGAIAAPAMREIGFPWSEAMVDRARRSVGATIAAARVALREGVAANIAGGTHHASSDKGSGFCVFNDAAVAARLMQAERGRAPAPPGPGGGEPLRVVVIDLDVHQGNGTAAIFRGDDSVFTLSMHGARNFPFRKQAGDLDVDLPDGCGDGEYLQALESALARLERRFAPGLVIYLAGADPHEGDRLGRLELSFGGLQARDRLVFDWAWQRRVPLALCMAGGYGVRIEDTVQVQVNTFAIASEYWCRWQNLRP
ncbi:histone deacetylase [Ramlibacter sp. RBP-2]|uniref:Histone deacetylase n=1 Tax=Ramlibacter lithotrophicus TaxID=2606681 RepID=A0A7X6DDF5_9BURK|nr:histone deacetylase [Ramlibacter lithotrophicus]NKE65131.1 histone deacetylase [Ramlibacter lithotrophicus]